MKRRQRVAVCAVHGVVTYYEGRRVPLLTCPATTTGLESSERLYCDLNLRHYREVFPALPLDLRDRSA